MKAFALILGLIMMPTASHSAELKVLAGGSMAGPMKELTAKFEQSTGHKLTVEFAGTPELIRQAASGAPFDAGFVPSEVMKNAEARAKFAEPVPIARVGYGVAVKAGAPKPDISTAEKFKDVMLKAQSYTLYPESASGAFVVKTFEKLGIAEAMKAKLKPQANTRRNRVRRRQWRCPIRHLRHPCAERAGPRAAGPLPGRVEQRTGVRRCGCGGEQERSGREGVPRLSQDAGSRRGARAKGVTPG